MSVNIDDFRDEIEDIIAEYEHYESDWKELKEVLQRMLITAKLGKKTPKITLDKRN